MKTRLFSLIVLASLLAGVFFAPIPSRAEVAKACAQNGFLGFPHWYEYLDVDAVTIDGELVCDVVGPAGDDGGISITQAAGRVALAILDILLRLAGIVAFFFIVYSGFKFTLSQGDVQKEKDARETAINAVIGMVITIFAVVIVTFVGRQIST